MTIGKLFQSDDQKPFHSSGYAEVSRGNTMGSMKNQSFGQRAHLERNRTSVGGYGNSLVGLTYIHRSTLPGSNTDQATKSIGSAVNRRQAGSLPPRSGVRMPQRAATFREPPTRYNPYG